MYVFVPVYVHEIISKKSKTQNYARISQFVYVHEIFSCDFFVTSYNKP